MKIDRLVSIIMILLDKERISAQELAEMFEVSPRTIYRDIDTINMAGIPIRSISGVGGGFEIMQKYRIDKKVFSTAELSALLMGLTSLSNMLRGDELVNAIAKVRSFTIAGNSRGRYAVILFRIGLCVRTCHCIGSALMLILARSRQMIRSL